METFLLNPNTAARNTAPQQDISPEQGDGDEEFSPLLMKAVDSQDENVDQQGLANDSENNFLDEATNSLLTGEVSETNFFSDTLEAEFTDELIGNAAIATSETALFEQVPSTEQAPLFTNSPSLSPEGYVKSQAFNSSSLETFNSAVVSEENVLPIQLQESPAPISQTGTVNELTAAGKIENLLIQQIQQIIDQGRSNGAIVITGSNGNVSGDQNQIENLRNLSNPLLAVSENGEIQTRQIGIIPPSDDTSIATQRSAKLEGVHQDTTEQYLNAKLDTSKDGKKDQFQQNSSEQKGADQQSKTDMQGSNQTPTTTVTDTKPGESFFGQQLSLNSSTNNQTVNIEGKFAPGANLPVPEKEIVNNLIQRFNVNPRLQTSKLTMQLHPAELGALKIDLLVEGDSIKANIVAQSQQVLETLEKHMPRLRTVLESQGFRVDSFEISMDGDGGKQKELFQEHFNSPQQQFASGSSSSPQTDSFETLLDSQEELDDFEKDASGVNLTV